MEISIFLWAGGRKGKEFFSLVLSFATRGLKNHTWKDDRKLMDEVVRPGVWS